MKKITEMTKEQWTAVLTSYGESVLAAGAALYLAGVTSPIDLLWSLVAAIIPVVIRSINPNDTAFGRVPDPKELDEALRNAEQKTAKKETKTEKVVKKEAFKITYEPPKETKKAFKITYEPPKDN